MSLAAPSHEPRWKFGLLWLVRGLLALAFLAAGGAKFYGAPMLVEEFEHIGLGQWFRYFTGALEILGAILILAPPMAAFSALILICVMAGAIVAHLFLIGGSPIPAVILLVLSTIVAYAKRDQIDVFFYGRE